MLIWFGDDHTIPDGEELRDVSLGVEKKKRHGTKKNGNGTK